MNKLPLNPFTGGTFLYIYLNGVWNNGHMEPLKRFFKIGHKFSIWLVAHPNKDLALRYKPEVLEYFMKNEKLEYTLYDDHGMQQYSKNDCIGVNHLLALINLNLDKKLMGMLSVRSSIDNSYIGNVEDAVAYVRLGISKFQVTHEGNNTASLGWHEKSNSWVGWSHRAMARFTVGSIVQKGDCAYQPRNPEEMLEGSLDFYEDNDNTRELIYKNACITEKDFYAAIASQYENKPVPPLKVYESTPILPGEENELPTALETICTDKLGIAYIYKITYPNGAIYYSKNFYHYPEVWGQGMWQAQSLDDARQMAIDFADDVS
jgi:hypothetical protein